ncbi:MAG: transcriptional repressor [Spirochaetes bacterium]|nr:transcriptional repressor [Spirochaetota bacterium]
MLDDLKTILEQKGIIPSYHRIKIYEYLVNNKDHPTADIIYTDMIKQIPTLSKTTIYNTLKTLSGKGLISSITIEDNEVRFDPDTGLHGHFKCLRCGNLYDIELCSTLKNGLSECINSLEMEHRITDSQVYFKGICKKCRT